LEVDDFLVACCYFMLNLDSQCQSKIQAFMESAEYSL